MHKQPKRTRFTIAIFGAMVISSSGVALAGPLNVPNTFVPGDPATAASVNQNFSAVESAVDDNDARVTTNTGNIGINTTNIGDNFALINGNTSAISDLDIDVIDLQNGQRPWVRTFIDVDCSSSGDPLALKTLLDNNWYTYTSFNITGNCDGPIYVSSPGIRLVGDTSDGVDSIVLPNPTPDPSLGAVFADGAHDLRIENLRIDATAWGTWLIAQGTDAAGVYARNAFVRLIDSDIVGGLYGINPFRNAIVRMQGTVNVTEFVNAGISAGDHSLVGTRGQVNISTTRTDGTGYIRGVEAYRTGIADFRAGLNISMPAVDPVNGIFPWAITSGDNSIVNVRPSGTVIIGGGISASSLSKVNINANANTGTIPITGDISVRDGAILNLYGENTVNNISVTGDIDIKNAMATIGFSSVGDIVLNFDGRASIFDSSVGFIDAFLSSTFEINEGSVNGASIGHGSVASIYGASVNSDIGVDGNAANLHITEGSGAGNLNGNTVFLCGNTTSYIGPVIGPTGTIDPDNCL